jgi:hypothetical protein
MLANSREARSRSTLIGAIAALAIGLLGVGATFAFANGPLALLGRSTKPSKSRVHRGTVGQGVQITRNHYFRFHHFHPGSNPTPPPADTTAPQTSITSEPSSPTTATSASFAFSSSEPGSSFECKVDGASWGSCATPKAYTGVAVGSHQFSVRATDAAQNVDTTPATDSWTVKVVTPPPDTTPPQTSITNGPGSTTTATSASFSFSSSEAGSSFECKLDNAVWSACATPEEYSGVSVGSHKFSVRAIDSAENVDATPATQSWTVEEEVVTPPADTTPPQTSILSGPAASGTATSASFSFSSSEAGSSFECKLDSAVWSACATPKAYTGVAVGSHQFSVRAIDSSHNMDATPATQSWTVEEETVVTPPPPPPPNEECTTVVSSISSAQSAVSSASPGSVVCLSNGSYGALALNATKATPGVVMRAQNPGQATLSSATMTGTNLTIARFKVNGEVTIEPGTTGMVVDHNRITGGYMGVNAGPTSSTQINDAAITNNQLVGPFGEDAIRLNRYHDANGDGIGILVEGNEITGVREDGNHSDCLQAVWVGDHLVYRKNYLHDNRCQGFFVKDQASPVVGINVEDNLFVRDNEPCAPEAPGCGQPAYFQVFGPYSGFVMRRNTFWTGDQVATFQNGTGADTKIENNVIYRLWNNTNMSGISYANNTRCKRETAEGGSWPSSTPGETVNCSPAFNNPATDDLRLIGSDRGVDWAPAEQHYGP